MKSRRRPPWGVGLPGNRWDLLDNVLPEEPRLVSVVVVHFRQQQELDRTLLALQRQTYPAARLELIVVDDGSPDSPSVPPGVILLVQPDQGFRAAAARNRGAAAATGDILCFLDADTVPEPDYVFRLTRLPSLNPEAVTVGRRLHADLDGAAAAERIETLGPRRALPDPQWLRDGYRATKDLLHADDRSYRYVISAVFACSRWFFDEVGGFDEGFQEYGGEDWEWAYRAWLGGALLAHVPRAVAWHHGPDFADRDLADAERQRRQQREAVRLAEFIPVPGSRGRGLHWFHPDILVELDESHSAVADLICLDAILTELPDAVVLVSDRTAELCANDQRVIARSASADLEVRLSRVRIRIGVNRPFRTQGAVLTELITRVVEAPLLRLNVVDRDEEALLTVENARATTRVQRWDSPDLYSCTTCCVTGIDAVAPDASLAAYFGGW